MVDHREEGARPASEVHDKMMTSNGQNLGSAPNWEIPGKKIISP